MNRFLTVEWISLTTVELRQLRSSLKCLGVRAVILQEGSVNGESWLAENYHIVARSSEDERVLVVRDGQTDRGQEQ